MKSVMASYSTPNIRMHRDQSSSFSHSQFNQYLQLVRNYHAEALS